MLNQNFDIVGDYFGEYKTDKSGNVTFEPKGSAFAVTKCSKVLETNETNLTIEYLENGKISSAEFSNSKFTSKYISDLKLVGIDIFEHNSIAFFKLLQAQKEALPITNVHSGLGWYIYKEREAKKGIFIFRADKAIGLNSSYAGELDLKPKGTFDGWKKLVEEQILGNPGLEMMVNVGLSACVTGIISQKRELKTTIYHIMAKALQANQLLQ